MACSSCGLVTHDFAYRSPTITSRRSACHDHALQIDPTPAYDPVHSPVRAGLDELPDLCALLRRETGRRAFGPAVQQTLGAVVIEAMDPVAQRLSVHPADPGRLRPVHPVENRSQR